MQFPEGSRGERDAPRMSEPTGQHLYLIFDDWDWGYSIRKLKLPLRSPHQPSLRPLEKRRFNRFEPRRSEHKRLPPPCICLEAVRRHPSFFAAVGTNIIAAHRRNELSTYRVLEDFVPIFDVRSQGVKFAPGLFFIGNPVFIPVGNDKLFALDIMSGFRMLSINPRCRRDEWSWDNLPMPPLKGTDFTSFAVDSDGLTIFASTECATFTFDTRHREWKQYSNCSLPFAGRANYVHALGIFVGLSKAPGTYGDLCFCRELGGDQNLRHIKENLLIKDPASRLGATLVYLGGSEPGFCLVECISTEGKSGIELLEELGDELEQPEIVVDEGDDASGSMQECGEPDEMVVDEGDSECGEPDELKMVVDEGYGMSGSMHDRHLYLYRLTTFSLSFDNNGDLTSGETCVEQFYKVPKKVSEAIYRMNPVAFYV